MTNQLKPCPFCGDELENDDESSVFLNSLADGYWWKHPENGCILVDFYPIGCSDKPGAKEAFIRKWNDRA